MKKRAGKKYRPRPILRNPLNYVLEGLVPVKEHSSDLLDIKIKHTLSMAALIKGEATKDDMDRLIGMNNFVHALVKHGFGKDYVQFMDAGREAVYAVCSRGKAAGRFTCTEEEKEALRGLMELHDAQMDVITIKDLERAIAYVEHEARTGRMTPIKAEIPTDE